MVHSQENLYSLISLRDVSVMRSIKEVKADNVQTHSVLQGRGIPLLVCLASAPTLDKSNHLRLKTDT